MTRHDAPIDPPEEPPDNPPDDTPEDFDEFTHWLATARNWSPGQQPTWIERLREDGLNLPEPDTLKPRHVRRTLRRLLHALADRGLYVTHTDHLDDAELYRYLVETALVLPKPPRHPDAVEVIDLCPPYGNGIETMLAAYASDEVRATLQSHGIDIPPRSSLKANRDRTLPTPWPDAM